MDIQPLTRCFLQLLEFLHNAQSKEMDLYSVEQLSTQTKFTHVCLHNNESPQEQTPVKQQQIFWTPFLNKYSRATTDLSNQIEHVNCNFLNSGAAFI